MKFGVQSLGFETLDEAHWVLLLLENLIWPLLLVVFVIFSLLLPEFFFSTSNIRFLLFSSAAIGALALAEGLCLLSGHFDLSVGAIAGFAAMFTAMWLAEWFPETPGIVGVVIILVLGGLIGLGNGISVGILGVNPFLQTLGFMIIFSSGTQILSHVAVTDLPESYYFVGGGTLVAGIPFAIPLILSIYVITWLLLRYTSFGLAIYAVGGDEQSALQAGIDTTRIIILVYVISGVLSGLAGLLYTGYIGTVTPRLTEGTLFVAFAAAVIGGISLFGGRGNIIGALGGVLLLAIIQAGLVMMQIPAEMVQTINGIVLLVTILIYTGEERLRSVILST